MDVISSFLGKVPQSTLSMLNVYLENQLQHIHVYPSENEVIFMPGTTFEVVADPLHHHGGLHIDI